MESLVLSLRGWGTPETVRRIKMMDYSRGLDGVVGVRSMGWRARAHSNANMGKMDRVTPLVVASQSSPRAGRRMSSYVYYLN